MYAVNNPVLYRDPSGDIVISALGWILIGAGVGGLLSGITDFIGQRISGTAWKDIDLKSVGISVISGAVSGAIGASSLGVVFQIALNAVLSGGESVIKNVANGDKIDWGEAAKRAGIGAFAGYLGGDGLQASANVLYDRIVRVGQNISTRQFSYYSSRIAETFAREFIKGTIKSIGSDFLIESIGNHIYIISKK